MKIRNDKTGQIIEVSEDQLSNYGITVQQPQTSSVPMQQPTQSTQSSGIADNVGNALVNLLKGAAQPFVNTGQRVAGSGFELGRQSDNALASLLNILGAKDAASKFQQSAAQSNPYVGSEKDIQQATSPVQIAKDSAGILSYAVPVKGANAAATFGKGALAGGLTGFSQSGDNVNNIVGNTALGALTGGAGGVVLDKLLGLGKGAAQVGGQIREGVMNPITRANPFMAEEEKAITKTLMDLGLKGSAGDMKQQLPTAFRKLSGDIDNVLSNSTKTLDTADLTTQINSGLDNNVNVDLSDPVMVKARDKFMNQIVQRANKGETGVTLTAKDIFQAKQNLGNQLSRTFDKLEKGTPLTPSEEVGLTIWENLDNTLTSLEPGVKDLTKAQSYLYKAAPGIAKSSKASINILGNQVPAGGLQKLQDAAGRSLQATGTGLDRVLGVVPQEIADRAGALGASNITAGVSNSPATQQDISTPQSGMDISAPMTQDTAPQNASGIPIITPEALQQAKVSLSDKSYAKIKDLYDLQQGSGAGNLTETARVAREKNKTALRALDDLKTELYDSNGNIKQDLLVKAMLPGAFGARGYRSTWGSIIDIIGTNRTGASYTPAQRADYANLLPVPGDDKATVKRKLESLQMELEGYAGIK